MRPWRENAVPHRDVLEGTFQQAEFAADITAVYTGKATREYQEPIAFFDRTFITEGMRLLLTQVAQRLAGKGGEPVIQLLISQKTIPFESCCWGAALVSTIGR